MQDQARREEELRRRQGDERRKPETQQKEATASQGEQFNDGEGELAGKLQERFDKLKQFMIDDLKKDRIPNAGLELGRPKQKFLDGAEPDYTNIFAGPTVDTILEIGKTRESNAVATGQKLTQIAAELELNGVPTEYLSQCMWDTAFYCASVGSSPYMDPDGVYSWDSGALMRDQIVAIIKKYTTLRKFCRAFAPVVWNWQLLHETPPTDWAKKGFSESTKYAAFDFFDYVKCLASIQPKSGLIREPTKEEYIAHKTHFKIATDRGAKNDRFASTSAEVTGGMFGCNVKTKFRDIPPCD